MSMCSNIVCCVVLCCYSHQPQRNPLKYRQVNRLEAMLQHAGHAMDCLYYEVLDLPLPQLEQLKTLKVGAHTFGCQLVRRCMATGGIG